MSETNALRVSVADLRRPGAARDLDVTAPVTGLTGDVDIPHDQPVHAQLHLERVSDGIVVRGEIQAHWHGVCSRCLAPVDGGVEVHVDELFEPDPIEGETYRLEHDELDLEPMVRDALTLELPRAPLCRDDCRGLCPTCGTDHNVATCDCATDEPDSRWAALRSLEI